MSFTSSLRIFSSKLKKELDLIYPENTLIVLPEHEHGYIKISGTIKQNIILPCYYYGHPVKIVVESPDVLCYDKV